MTEDITSNMTPEERQAYFFKKLDEIFAEERRERGERGEKDEAGPDMGFESDLIHRLKRARIERLITQRELALRLGIKQSSLARFESGKGNPSLAYLSKIARALDKKIVIQ